MRNSVGRMFRDVEPQGSVFDKPQWRILPAKDVLLYRPGFENTVQVGPWNNLGRVLYRVSIHVPADVFSYILSHEWGQERTIVLRLLSLQEEFRFCIHAGDHLEWLWSYRGLPVWAENR